MPRDVELNRSEIEDRWAKVLLAQIFQPSVLLDSSGYRRTVVMGDLKLFDNNIL